MAGSKASEYTYRVYWSEQSGGYIARCTEFPSLTNYSEDSQLDAFTGMVDLVQFVLDDMASSGETPPCPMGRMAYSGHLSLRMTPEQHRRLAMESSEQGVSINHLVCSRA